MERELNARRREEIWWEYSDGDDELLTERKLYQDSKLLRTAVRMRIPFPPMRDGAGNLTASWEQDYAGRPFLRAEAFCELRKMVRDEYWAQRGALIQWLGMIIKAIKGLLFTGSLLFLNTSVSYGGWNETQPQSVDQYVERQQKEKEKVRQDEIDKVEISVRYDREKCSVSVRPHPHQNAIDYGRAMLEAEKKSLLVSITNKSHLITAKVKWSLTVHRKGHSDDLTDYRDLPSHQQSEFNRSNSFANDKILRPNESDEQCYDLPYMSGGYPPDNLVYSVKSKTVEFMK